MGSSTASGATVRHSSTATAIGDDGPTINNFKRSVGAGGLHDVILHGNTNGRPLNNGRVVNIQEVADAVLAIPAYNGCAIRLVMCHGGLKSARQLGKILGVDVTSSTRIVQLDPLTGKLLEGPR